jgi:hypothetical protein
MPKSGRSASMSGLEPEPSIRRVGARYLAHLSRRQRSYVISVQGRMARMARIFMRPLCTEDARSYRDENCGLTPVPVSVLGWSTGPQGPVAGGAASLRGHSAGDRLIGRLGGRRRPSRNARRGNGGHRQPSAQGPAGTDRRGRSLQRSGRETGFTAVPVAWAIPVTHFTQRVQSGCPGQQIGHMRTPPCWMEWFDGSGPAGGCDAGVTQRAGLAHD